MIRTSVNFVKHGLECLPTAFRITWKTFSPICEYPQVASDTSELSSSSSQCVRKDAKPRAKGLRSARTDIVVFLAFISKSRSGGCPAAEGLEMKAIFPSRSFLKKKKKKTSGEDNQVRGVGVSGEGGGISDGLRK